MNILTGQQLRIEAGTVTGAEHATAIAQMPQQRAVATIRGVGVSAKTGNVANAVAESAWERTALLRTEYEN
jgi:hypothetical protein